MVNWCRQLTTHRPWYNAEVYICTYACKQTYIYPKKPLDYSLNRDSRYGPFLTNEYLFYSCHMGQVQDRKVTIHTYAMNLYVCIACSLHVHANKSRYLFSMGICYFLIPLQWRHNGLDSVSNHQPHHCLLNRLFERRSKKTSFPAQMASNAENVSIWWRHHDQLSSWIYAVDK